MRKVFVHFNRVIAVIFLAGIADHYVADVASRHQLIDEALLHGDDGRITVRRFDVQQIIDRVVIDYARIETARFLDVPLVDLPQLIHEILRTFAIFVGHRHPRERLDE